MEGRLEGAVSCVGAVVVAIGREGEEAGGWRMAACGGFFFSSITRVLDCVVRSGQNRARFATFPSQSESASVRPSAGTESIGDTASLNRSLARTFEHEACRRWAED